MNKCKRELMLKTGVYILASSMIFMLGGCGNNETTDDMVEVTFDNYSQDYLESGIENEADYVEDLVESGVEDENDLMDDFAESEIISVETISFDGDVIFTPESVLYLKNDGTIWGTGANEEGQLGNGQRVDSSSWTQVEGINNAIKICHTGNHFYALTSDGELYHWGSNIFSPEKITAFSHVIDISNSSDDNVRNRMIVTSEDGQRYAEMTADYFHEYFIPLDFDDAQDICVSPDSFILVDGCLYNYAQNKEIGELTYIDDAICEQSFQEVYTLKKIQCDELLSGGYCNFRENGNRCYFVGQDSGQLYEWKDDGKKKNLECVGGSNIKNFAIWNYNTATRHGNKYYLFWSGVIRSSGNNNFGQLGDGTCEDLWNAEWDIKGHSFTEMVSWSARVAAIDSDNNVWAWGDGFDNEPEIIINAQDFYND